MSDEETEVGVCSACGNTAFRRGRGKTLVWWHKEPQARCARGQTAGFYRPQFVPRGVVNP